MKNISIWISTMRLRTLPLSISGIILASCFAVYNGKTIQDGITHDRVHPLSSAAREARRRRLAPVAAAR